MKTRILMLLAVLMVSAVGAKADNWLYAEVSGTTVTIKCCEYTAIPDGAIKFNATDTWNSSFRETVTTAVIDESCQNFNRTSLKSLFRRCEVLENITGLENLNTSSVTDMRYMFQSCEKLSSPLDLSSFNTSGVTTMQSMFDGCKLLPSVKVGSWNTASVTNMSYMFYDCEALVSLDLSGWNTAKVENMTTMFGHCTQLATIYVSDDWSTTSVTSSDYMFYNCSAIKGEDGTTYNSSNITADYAHFGAGGYLRNNYLYDAVSSEDHLSDWNGKTFGAVKISGRTLKAGHWNTLYLPFALDADQIAASFPAGTEVKEFNSYSNDGTILTLGFTDAATMDAGYPYIVYIPAGENITDPVFRNVVIQPSYNGVKKGDATFAGVFNPLGIGASRYRLFLQNDMFYYPSAHVSLNGFRAYFYMDSNPVPETASAKIIIDWGDGETTGIANTDFADETDGVWYTLQGVKLDGKPTEKGIYIINGKKVAVQ